MDIREILKALAPEDRQLWAQFRTEMRRTYISAHNSTMGTQKWDGSDDAFLDIIDIKLATLFDRCGKVQAANDVIGKEDVAEVEKKIEEASVNGKMPDEVPSLASKALETAWGK